MENILAISLFCLIILVSNIIQGITGFAGTLIAMPFLIMLVDLETAKQVLNYLGIVASLWILYKDHRYLNWPQVRKILGIMLVGLFIGIASYNYLPTDLLLIIFPIFVLFVGVRGLLTELKKESVQPKKERPLFETILLLSAGIIHGLFVSGGPMLVAYATTKINNKHEFRATLSAVWVVLNSIMFIQNLLANNLTKSIVVYMAISTVVLFIGLAIGEKLLKKMSQATFMKISYFLLILSSISLLI